MPCTQETNRCKIKKGDLLNDCCKKNLLQTLIFIDKIFNENKIIYWLDYGTLLGAVRNGAIIDYDDDCDIGVLRQDFEKILKLSDTFRLAGYCLLTYFYPDFIRLDFSRENDLHVDIFIWEFTRLMFDNDPIERIVLNRTSYLPKDEKKGKHFPAYFLFPMEKIKLSGYDFYCPTNPKRFVEFRYGSNWQIPIIDRVC